MKQENENVKKGIGFIDNKRRLYIITENVPKNIKPIVTVDSKKVDIKKYKPDFLKK